MALLYLDTSALVKLYVQEAGTNKMLELVHPDAGHSLAILALSRVEFRAAVRRRTKLGGIDEQVANQLINAFNSHVTNLFQVQPVNEQVLEQAVNVIDRYALRAYDAVQLGGCLTLDESTNDSLALQFICADEVLLQAAREEGLSAVNPTDE